MPAWKARMRFGDTQGVPLAGTTIETPLGPLTLVGSDRGLSLVLFQDGTRGSLEALPDVPDDEGHPILRRAGAELGEYFAGTRRTFGVSLDLGGSRFQRRVWDELRRIPYGATVSYGQIAERLGDRRKARAVGGANARNPIPVIVPCHRVIGSNGDLTGFGGGIERKRFLLRLEAARKAAVPADARGRRCED